MEDLKFQALNTAIDSVIHFTKDVRNGTSAHKVSFLAKQLYLVLKQKAIPELIHWFDHKGKIPSNVSEWLEDGVECEIMEPGMFWRKGKVRIKVTLEFAPDESVPEIDELRQM